MSDTASIRALVLSFALAIVVTLAMFIATVGTAVDSKPGTTTRTGTGTGTTATTTGSGSHAPAFVREFDGRDAQLRERCRPLMHGRLLGRVKVDVGTVRTVGAVGAVGGVVQR